MADICSLCSSDPDEAYFDIDLRQIAKDLDKGHSINVLCESCNIRAIYKDEEDKIHLGYQEDEHIKFKEVLMDQLPGAKVFRFMGITVRLN